VLDCGADDPAGRDAAKNEHDEGEHGQDVKTLQTWLNEVGYHVARPGYFGTRTKQEVDKFQRDDAVRRSYLGY